jgi:hypothetical protein
MVKAYALFGGFVVAALTWAHFTGWAPGDVTEAKGVPTSVRDNPGSARPAYGGRSWTGAK